MKNILEIYGYDFFFLFCCSLDLFLSDHSSDLSERLKKNKLNKLQN